MPKKLADNIRDAYEAEKLGLQARLDANGSEDWRAKGWSDRIAAIDKELGTSKRAVKKETRPAPAASEKRPQE